MSTDQLVQYANQLFVYLNIGLAAFVAAAPADHQLPWYVIAAAAALNAVVHGLPSVSSAPKA